MTKVIPILSGRCLVVELPEKHEAAFKALRNGRELTINRKNKSANVDHISFDFEFAELLFSRGLLDCTSGNLDTGDRHYLFGLGWRIIGMLSEVTEEQLDGIVESDTFMRGDVTIHKNYNQGGWLPTRTMSLESAILAEGFMFSMDECPNQFCENGKIDVGYGEFASCGICEESRVLDRSRCLLLGREL